MSSILEVTAYKFNVLATFPGIYQAYCISGNHCLHHWQCNSSALPPQSLCFSRQGSTFRLRYHIFHPLSSSRHHSPLRHLDWGRLLLNHWAEVRCTWLVEQIISDYKVITELIGLKIARNRKIIEYDCSCRRKLSLPGKHCDVYLMKASIGLQLAELIQSEVFLQKLNSSARQWYRSFYWLLSVRLTISSLG